jgi:hypothetical protein
MSLYHNHDSLGELLGASSPKLMDGTRMRPWVKLTALISGGIFLFGLGYALHPQKVKETKTVQHDVQVKEVHSDPDSPVTVNDAGRWTFIREKATGCVWIESYNDPKDPNRVSLQVFAKPSDKVICQ